MTTDYRERQVIIGKEFEKYVGLEFESVGGKVIYYLTKDDQLAHGDFSCNGVNYEVKKDTNYSATKKLFFETKERYDANAGRLVSSGIFAQSDAVWIVIGDEDNAWMFNRNALRSAIKTMPYGFEKKNGKDDKGNNTSEGYCILIEKIESVFGKGSDYFKLW